jgi:type I restriction enzyme R subunit
MPARTESRPGSPNFEFLTPHHELLVRYAAQAERFVFEDANLALIRLRQFGELLAQQACAYVGIPTTEQTEFSVVLNLLRDRRAATSDVLDLFHGLRKAGNSAVHSHVGTQSEALHQLRMARTLAVWFHRAFGKDPHFKAGPFVPPPDPAHASRELSEELERLRQQVVRHQNEAEHATTTAAQESEARRQAELSARRAYDELAAALALAEESEARLATERKQFLQQIAALQASVAAAPATAVEAVVTRAQQAASLLDLDEAATRRIIDAQLRDAGWEADSETIRFKMGVRPQKGRNVAIAEWPTASGPADYVLFVGLMPVAAVEAKRAIKDVPGHIGQSKRYSCDFRPSGGETLIGPWGDYKLPFLFATNGRPFLQQLRTKSGIWFLDARLLTNLSRPLEGWYTPDGLAELLKLDTTEADQRLADESPEFLPLRDYQFAAIQAIEKGIADGLRELLVAMATGTGKTRTCIGLVYRLIKARRFRRVLFLVDRSALGEQTANAFKDVKLENLQSFTEIYDVKELGDITPAAETRLHIATIQGMVKRLLFPDENGPAFPVDTYDAIVVDECHRGYSLDQELTEAELTFRNEADYVSKYRRVLDHFDAVKIGLTATPALHTTEIFGRPIYQYSYRQAVIDGYLIDHEPPVRIVTKLAEDGITWKKGETIQTYLPFTGQIDPVTAPDEVSVEIDEFNRRVITESFNRVVCAELARHIDPNLTGKTIIFCVGDSHADMVVDLLKQAFADQYGAAEDNAVAKITAAAHRPMQLIRRFKNERLPNVAVTVDLLTTGIDVPEVVNIVFLRRVRSRILYEQMLGRATRLCPDLHGPNDDKEVFRIFDAVDLYEALQPYTDMKPVVVQPFITFEQLAQELATVTTPEVAAEVHAQFAAKFQRRKALLVKHHADQFAALTGTDPATFARQLKAWTPEQTRTWLAEHPQFPAFLDRAGNLDSNRVLISDHADEVRRVERGYGTAKKPEDYLESFRAFIHENLNHIPALLVVTQRPRDLTRQQLRELKLALDAAGFTEVSLQTAWREATNQDIAATIIGYVRHVANGAPLLPYRERVARAMQTILASRPWTAPQRKWLERIGKQLEAETIVDHDAFEHGQFKAEGGFQRLNKVFDGKLDDILKDIADALWQSAA